MKKSLRILENEVLFSIFNNYKFFSNEADGLYAPITCSYLKRQKNLSLVLRTTLGKDAKLIRRESEADKLTIVSNHTELKSESTATALIKNTVTKNIEYFFKKHKNDTQQRVETSYPQWVELSIIKEQTTARTICFFYIGKTNYIWPRNTNFETKEKSTIDFSSTNTEDKFELISSQFGGSRDCAFLSIGSEKVILRINNSENSGSLIFQKFPPKPFQEKIIICLSLALGVPTIRLGSTCFSENWEILSATAEDGNLFSNNIFNLRHRPPSPLCFDQNDRLLDETKLNKFVNALLENFDYLELSQIHWDLMMTRCVPYHMESVCISSIIESIFAKLKAREENSRNTIIRNKTIWKSISKEILNLIKLHELDDETKKLLVNKVQNLNSLPTSKGIARMFSLLKMEISEKEEKAWSARNLSAHGTRPTLQNYTNFREKVETLYVILNRLLISVCGANDFYFDYSRYDAPKKKISEAAG